MKKVLITADTVLSIIQSVFNDNDIDIINGGNLPEVWQGKRVQDILNIKYYTFKHRPESTEMIVAEKKREGVAVDELEALNRAFGCLTLASVDRMFASNTDVATCDASLDFWVQTSKIKLLEYLIDKVNVALSGRVLPLDFKMQDGTTEHRTVALVLGRLISPEFEPESEIGESVQCSVDVQLTIQPSTILMSNVKIEFATVLPESEDLDTVMTEVVVEQFSMSAITQNKALPLAQNNAVTGVINLSQGRTFSLTIPAIKNDFIDWLTAYALGAKDINSVLYLRVTVDQQQSLYTTVITNLNFETKNDGTDAVYSLTLSERGL